jgi:HupE / UreJ protein
MRRTLITALVFLFAMIGHAFAHKPSDSYLKLDVQSATIAGQWDIALRDLDYAIGLDADQDGNVTWGEVKRRHGEIAAYALARLSIAADGASCSATATGHLIDEHSDGAYAVLRFSAACPKPPTALKLNYSLFFELDPQHRGLLNLSAAGQTSTAIFSKENPSQELTIAAPGLMQQFLAFVREGATHIWIGYDHILFLLSLLLPSVLVHNAKAAGAWQAVASLKPVMWNVAAVVTAFTIAHSITLSLAALEVVSLPSRLVESAIAASVVLAALNNIWPVISSRWSMAFAFGLIHGFGFASVLRDLGLPQDALLTALLAFNVGVELGQLAIVAVFLPLAYGLAGTRFYQRGVLMGGSAAAAAVAAVWFMQRAFGVTI